MRNIRTLNIAIRIFVALVATVWVVTGIRAGLLAPGEWLHANPTLVLAYVATGGVVVGLCMLYAIFRLVVQNHQTDASDPTPYEEMGVDGLAEFIADVRRRESRGLL